MAKNTKKSTKAEFNKISKVTGTVTSWLPDTGLGFFESKTRRVGFNRKSLPKGAKDLKIGDRVVGEVNSRGFAVTLKRARKTAPKKPTQKKAAEPAPVRNHGCTTMSRLNRRRDFTPGESW